MKKIPTLFIRDRKTGFVIPEINPGTEWVLEGKYSAHKKYDGVCTGLFLAVKGEVRVDGMVRSDEVESLDDITEVWMARREVKQGHEFPEGFVIEEFDNTTKKTFGWEPIDQSPFYKYWKEARTTLQDDHLGTYELCGPKINGNPEGYTRHVLLHHETTPLLANINAIELSELTVEEAYDALKETLAYMPVEGAVWHSHKHGMVKLKKRDFAYE